MSLGCWMLLLMVPATWIAGWSTGRWHGKRLFKKEEEDLRLNKVNDSLSGDKTELPIFQSRNSCPRCDASTVLIAVSALCFKAEEACHRRPHFHAKCRGCGITWLELPPGVKASLLK